MSNNMDFHNICVIIYLFIAYGIQMIIDFLDLPQLLLDRGVVGSISAANSAAMYAARWAQCEELDFKKSQVSLNRARLRKVGLDIAKPFNRAGSGWHAIVLETNIEGF